MRYLIFATLIFYHVLMRNILHPTDRSPESRAAFVHALRVALAARSRLSLLRVASGGPGAATAVPGVRQTLEQWGLLPPGSPKEAVKELGLEVYKAAAEGGDPVHAALAYLRSHPAELVVLAGDLDGGRARWLQQSIAEPVTGAAAPMTLFMPRGADGFVSHRNGSIALRSILLPIAGVPEPSPALEAVRRLARLLGCAGVRITLLHVGEMATAPPVKPPEGGECAWEIMSRRGDIVETVLATAAERFADLIVMPTAGRHGFLDALRGSTTERVLRRSGRPLLAVPATGAAS
jgi:nucleotide-binding universal stress UspA family protein